jgi:hypothetical protein
VSSERRETVSKRVTAVVALKETALTRDVHRPTLKSRSPSEMSACNDPVNVFLHTANEGDRARTLSCTRNVCVSDGIEIKKGNHHAEHQGRTFRVALHFLPHHPSHAKRLGLIAGLSKMSRASTAIRLKRPLDEARPASETYRIRSIDRAISPALFQYMKGRSFAKAANDPAAGATHVFVNPTEKDVAESCSSATIRANHR